MKLKKDKVGLFNYTLKNTAGEEIDSSSEQPMAYLHGYGNLIPGLEKEMLSKTVGNKFNTTIKAVDAYGEIAEHLIQKEVPLSMFQGVKNIEVGMRFEAQAEGGGVHSVIITEKNDDTVTVDGNHPLAGQELTFEIEITAVRNATKEEIEHKHAHGDGGHQH
jgi:FKBP-type peptidyl-prolyl cis-trans isomerase SlyD